MKKSLPQLRKQIEQLQKQAEELQRKESREVIARIKEAIAFYNLSAADLGFGGGASSGRARAAAAPKSSRRTARRDVVKYRDDAGNVWGGRGPRPQWLRDALAAGRSIEDFRVDGTPAPAAGEARAKPAAARKRGAKKRAASTIKFRDSAGNTWSGRGPKPRWLTNALAAGASLDDLKA